MFEENIIETEVSSNTIETQSDSLIGTPGIDGVTFTPSVSQEGVISWTNDGGLPNPEPINIKGIPGANGIDGEKGEKGDKGERGEKGEKGDRGEQGIQGIQGVPGLQGIRGEKGDAGEPGIPGEKGEKGDKGDKGDDGLPVSINVNGNTYSHTNGTITLPDYPLKENLGYKTITIPDISLLDAGLYIYLGHDRPIEYGDWEGLFNIRYGNLLQLYKDGEMFIATVMGEGGVHYTYGFDDDPFVETKRMAYDEDVPNISDGDIERWNEAGKGKISSDTFSSIVVVDSLTDVEQEEGVLYLVKDTSEPVLDYVTKPTMEIGEISDTGELLDDSEHYRTAHYVYVHGKRSISISNGTGNNTLVLAYDKNKNFMTDWYKRDDRLWGWCSLENGLILEIPEGAYYIKGCVWTSEIPPLTITYYDVEPV